MIKPHIHTNGTSPDALIDAYIEAANRLSLALRALDAAAPNARDYYPQGPDAFEKARAEHLTRVDRLKSVLRELGDLTEHCAEYI